MEPKKEGESGWPALRIWWWSDYSHAQQLWCQVVAHRSSQITSALESMTGIRRNHSEPRVEHLNRVLDTLFTWCDDSSLCPAMEMFMDLLTRRLDAGVEFKPQTQPYDYAVMYDICGDAMCIRMDTTLRDLSDFRLSPSWPPHYPKTNDPEYDKAVLQAARDQA